MCNQMDKPLTLLFNNQKVATLSGFSFETPWAYATAEFDDVSLEAKLERLANFRAFGAELEQKELPEDKEEILWKEKLVELKLSHSDLKLDRDEDFSVEWSDDSVREARSLSYGNKILMWRP